MNLKAIIQEEFKPALGCTEPAAVALAVARACQELPNKQAIETVVVRVSKNVYKNGMYVGVPGTHGLVGNTIAAALGAICGNPDFRLEVLRPCTEQDVLLAKQMIAADKVKVLCEWVKSGVYIQAEVVADRHKVYCTIEQNHTCITKVNLDGEDIYVQEKAKHCRNYFDEDLSFLRIINEVSHIDRDDVNYLLQGAKMNLTISERGLSLEKSSPYALGRTLKEIVSDSDFGDRIRVQCCAAVDARMSGEKLPVMSSFGSGNQGIVITLPAVLVGQRYSKAPREIAQAILLGHVASGYLKSCIGKVTSFCGCTVTAGAGAAAGLTYLLGGSVDQIQQAFLTMISNTAGMICDGAKASCSFKVGIGAYEAYLTASLALKGKGVRSPEGVIGKDLGQTIGNLVKLDVPSTDRTIVDILDSYAEIAPTRQ